MLYKIGQKAQIKKIFTIKDVKNYILLSGDTNSIHLSENAIIPGIMICSLWGGLLGSILPGEGTIHLGQTARFINPVYIGEEITAKIEIIKIRKDKPIITFKTECYNNSNSITVKGESVVKYINNISNRSLRIT